jgi:hypothetical protein
MWVSHFSYRRPDIHCTLSKLDFHHCRVHFHFPAIYGVVLYHVFKQPGKVPTAECVAGGCSEMLGTMPLPVVEVVRHSPWESIKLEENRAMLTTCDILQGS